MVRMSLVKSDVYNVFISGAMGKLNKAGISLAQEVRQKSDTGSECDCQGSSYTKNEYNLLHQKLDAEYFFIQQFKKKKTVFVTIATETPRLSTQNDISQEEVFNVRSACFCTLLDGFH